jgi:lysophospholipase L1-like esterase
MAGRFVALGDSYTEGVGDRDDAYPNGVRGWADRVAKQLGRANPSWEYANLAIRSKVLDDIVDEQVEQALALEPTLVSFFAGGNDILRLRSDVPDVLRRYEAAVARIASSGARLLLFTSYDVRVSPLLEPLRPRNNAFNRGLRRVAAEHDAILIDHWAMTAYADPRMWDTDRLHMSRHGHKYLAAKVLAALRVDHTLAPKQFKPLSPLTFGQALARERDWFGEWISPLIARKLRGETLGDSLTPKWPEPMRPAEGMKRQAAASTSSVRAPGPGEHD